MRAKPEYTRRKAPSRNKAPIGRKRVSEAGLSPAKRREFEGSALIENRGE